jgi:hypothetical protein
MTIHDKLLAWAAALRELAGRGRRARPAAVASELSDRALEIEAETRPTPEGPPVGGEQG